MANEPFDKRITLARPDLAEVRFRGRIDAARYVEGQPATIATGIAQVRSRPDLMASLDTQALFGERAVYAEHKDGWVWLQLVHDGYVGYVREEDLRFGGWRERTHRVCAIRAPVFARPDLKSAPHGFLPLNAELAVLERRGGYSAIAEDRWLADQHIVEAVDLARDWVAVAESILGAPYLWGGKSPDGLDCSGLIQSSMHAAGYACPRDTDMQERALGEIVPQGAKLRRGDLVFWKGHVGVLRSEAELLHANAHHMAVASEPVADAIARIAANGTPVSCIRRLAGAIT